MGGTAVKITVIIISVVNFQLYFAPKFSEPSGDPDYQRITLYINPVKKG
jgi:hypothetical protein